MAHVPTASYPICPICSEHIEIETANTGDEGRAVHEEWYATLIAEKSRKVATFRMAVHEITKKSA